MVFDFYEWTLGRIVGLAALCDRAAKLQHRYATRRRYWPREARPWSRHNFPIPHLCSDKCDKRALGGWVGGRCAGPLALFEFVAAVPTCLPAAWQLCGPWPPLQLSRHARGLRCTGLSLARYSAGVPRGKCYPTKKRGSPPARDSSRGMAGASAFQGTHQLNAISCTPRGTKGRPA